MIADSMSCKPNHQLQNGSSFQPNEFKSPGGKVTQVKPFESYKPKYKNLRDAYEEFRALKQVGNNNQSEMLIDENNKVNGLYKKVKTRTNTRERDIFTTPREAHVTSIDLKKL